jgi:hypothetical protein
MWCSSCNSSQCPCLEDDYEEVEEIEIDEYEEVEPISENKLNQVINNYFNK